VVTAASRARRSPAATLPVAVRSSVPEGRTSAGRVSAAPIAMTASTSRISSNVNPHA
jgi:hypothetical protein